MKTQLQDSGDRTQKSRFNTDVSFKKHKTGRAGARNTKPQPQSKSTLSLRKDVTKTKEN